VIRIITSPTVAVIGRTMFDTASLQPYLDAIGAAAWDSDSPKGGEVVVEVAGRVCYRSFANPRPGGNSAYLAHILESGHGSVLEHASWTLLLTGISRNLTHEFVRHRAGFAYSMRSQRYCDDSEVGFVVPPAIKPNTVEWLAWHSRCDEAAMSYSHIVWRQMRIRGTSNDTSARKRAREAARSVLPGCTATELVVTGNGRSWRHWLEMRGSLHAEAEIRRLALAVLPILKREAPNIFADMEVRTDNGIDHIHAQHHKV
jgi:thymidylate synthase (FAD)